MIGIVVVVYKSFEDTVEFITNEIPKIEETKKVVIVDNAATVEGSRQLAESCNAALVNESDDIDKQHNVFVISEKENLGYARGNNVGAKFLNENFDIEYFVFSNNDIQIIEKDVISKLTTFLRDNEKIALAGPMIQEPAGAFHEGHTKTVTIYRRIGWNILPFLRKKVKSTDESYRSTTPYECIWVSGCFFVIKNEAFKKVDGFDNGTFLYGEEIILSERLKRIGYKTYFYPNATIIHAHSQTIGKTFNYYKMQELNMTSAVYYYKHYKNVPKLFLWLYKISFRWSMRKFK